MITIEGLTKVYGQTTAISEVSFEAHPGRVTALLGPNGAGKSTTLRLLLGLDRPTSGSALVNGYPYRSLRTPLTVVGAQLDGSGAHPGRTAKAHLRWVALSNAIPSGRVLEVLELVGLAEVANKRVRTFSLGMRQRLGIATALLGDPDIVVFDEPMNGLDAEGIRWIRGLLRGLAVRGRTVLVSSHLLGELATISDDLVVIAGGKVIRQGPIAELVHGYADLEEAYFDWTEGQGVYVGLRQEPGADA